MLHCNKICHNAVIDNYYIQITFKKSPMKFTQFIKQLLLGFPEQFSPGDKVNAIDHAGSVYRADGVVIAKSRGIVIVDWPCAGFSRESGTSLCRIMVD